MRIILNGFCWHCVVWKLREFDMISREQLINDYLDFVNNYLSVSLFAEHRGLTEDQARLLLDVAKMVFNSTHPES